MDHGALDDALEPGRGLGILPAVRDQVGQLGVDILDQIALQRLEIDVAGPHHRGGVLIVDQGEEEVFESGVFVPPLAGERQGAMESLFKAAGETRQSGLLVSG